MNNSRSYAKMFDPRYIELAYVGPETIIPLSSVLAAIGGGIMIFWNHLRRGATWCVLRLRRKSSVQ